MQDPAAQVPFPGKINVDHVAHFVPHIDAASAALSKLGFSLTPFSPQSHRLEPGGPVVPAGTGNRCVMLKSGYIEFLTPTGDTPIANQLRAAINRYVGVHLIAFGTSAPDLDHARLAKGGFEPLAPVALQRGIETSSGSDTARFTVVRVPPGVMPEGRIQFCQHHTPQLVWQARWLEHKNGAEALTGVLLCVADPREAAERYGRYTALVPRASGNAWRLDTGRGYLSFIDAQQCRRSFGMEPPALPWIAGYVVATASLSRSHDCLIASGLSIKPFVDERCIVELPAEVGGLMVFEPLQSMPLAFDS